MKIEKVKFQKNGFLVNDAVFVPEALDNSDYQKIQNWIAAGGTVEPEFSTEEIKLNLIAKIKSEAGRRITSTYPEYKQRNLNGAVSEIQNKEVISLKAGTGNYTPTADEMTLLRAAKACKDFIDRIRTKSNQLEASLDLMTQEQLNAFNPSEDSNWE